MARVLVYGGRGALGATCVDFFKAKGCYVCSVDLAENDKADCNVVVPKCNSMEEQATSVAKSLQDGCGKNKFDAILCVAGGWAGGNASSDDFIKNTELVIKQSIWTSAIACKLAALFLKDGGLLQLTGAQPALSGTPGMIGYGMAKAAVHHLTKSMSQDKSGLPNAADCIAILPITLDTPMNRKFMPNADHTKWTSMEFVASKLFEWTSNKSSRFANGSLVQLVTEGGDTKMVLVE